MNLLLIDDDPFVLKLLRLQLANLSLKRRGIKEVIACDSGEAALTELRRPDADIGLIICDLQMPETDGIEIVRHLVELHYAGGLVLISGEDQRILQAAERLARAHRLHVLGALNKPVTPEQLQRTLDRLLTRFEQGPPSTRKRYRADELAQAISAGRLINYYQPKVSLESGAVIGVETLVRWQHPDDGLVLPTQFMAAAEQDAVIDELAREVLSEALIQARRWQDDGLELKIAVNVSMANLAELRFPDWLAGEALAAGVPLSVLVLEITESQLMHDPRAALDILARLRLKHIGLSIDDFGTGYSSLMQLRDLPFTELKIDYGFVHGAYQDSAQGAILEASLGLARQLDIAAVAEGVEDLADWNHLRALGCQLAQGHFIGRPMPADEFGCWLNEWEARRQRLVA